MVSFLHIQISGMTINGRRQPDVNYSRTEHADGTITETGKPPPGTPVGATLDQVMAAAAGEPVSAARAKPARRRTNNTKKDRR